MDNKYSRWLHHSAAIVGGFFGVYTILNRMEFFGNAQTSNMLYLVLAICGRNLIEIFIRLGGVFIYIIGTFLYLVLSQKTKVSTKRLSILIDFFAVCILYFLPEKMNPILALYPIFFAVSFQWNAFAGAYGYISSTIFSTNNIKQFTLSMGDYILNRNEESKHRGLFFLGSICGFHIGVFIGYFFCTKYGVRGIIGTIPCLILVGILEVFEEHARNIAKTNCIAKNI